MINLFINYFKLSKIILRVPGTSASDQGGVTGTNFTLLLKNPQNRPSICEITLCKI